MADKEVLLLDIVTSSDTAFIEAVVGATVSTLYGAGLDTDQIAALFLEETNGRITVKFSEVGSGPWSVRVTDQDDDGNVSVCASEEGGSDTGSAGGDTGGGTGGDTGGDAGGGTGGDAGGGTDGGIGGGTKGRTLFEFIRDLFWNTFQGAAAGAGLGAVVTLKAGGTGAVPGTWVGAGYGVLHTLAGGVWDPGPNDPNNPCGSPFILC